MPLRLLSLVDGALVGDFLRRYPPVISELTFTNLYVWRHSRPIFLDVFRETLLFFVKRNAALILFGPPLGPVGLPELLRDYDGQLAGMERFPAKEAEAFFLDPSFVKSPDRDNADYVYLQEDLATLAGRRFSKKRNHIHQCLTEYACQYEVIGRQAVPECLDLLDRWCASRDCAIEPGLCSEYQAVRETLMHWDVFPLIGGAIRIDGRMEAFTLAEALNPDTAVCHFEKAMPSFHGLSQLINHWFARNSLAAFTYVNREQDLGIPGLRRAKESYFPDHLVEKVCFARKGTSDGTLCGQTSCGASMMIS